MMIRRRAVLVGAAATAAGVARAEPSGGSARMPDVLVLGAGMAGLNAAWLLEQQGMSVTVLEGRGRVGGRVHTLFDLPGLPEMGFNSMAAGYGRGIDAARRAGVELYDVGPRFMKGGPPALVLGRRVLSREYWAASPDNPFPGDNKATMPWELSAKIVHAGNPLKDWSAWIDPANAKLDVSLRDFLLARGLNDAAIRLAVDASPYYGTSASDVSALMYEFNDGWVRTQTASGPQSWAVTGGNERLPMAMAGLLKGDVLLGKKVVGITSEPDAATVTCGDGSTYRARFVVCSLPFSTLRSVRIEPALSGAQAAAVARLPYQPISFIFFTARSPFWETDGLPASMWTDGIAGTVSAQHFGPDPDAVSGFLAMARGALAVRWDALGAAEAMRRVVDEIEAIRPAARDQLVAARYFSWMAEPFNLGDWAYFGPGQIAAFATAMAAPAGRVRFCGEHTALANRGLEGALESSERVALEVLGA